LWRARSGRSRRRCLANTIYWWLTVDGLRPWQMTDPTPRQRGRPTLKLPCQTVSNIWSWAPDGARHQDGLTVGRTVTHSLTHSVIVGRKVTLTLSLSSSVPEFQLLGSSSSEAVGSRLKSLVMTRMPWDSAVIVRDSAVSVYLTCSPINPVDNPIPRLQSLNMWQYFIFLSLNETVDRA
jgi:hypothetical protein